MAPLLTKLLSTRLWLWLSMPPGTKAGTSSDISSRALCTCSKHASTWSSRDSSVAATSFEPVVLALGGALSVLRSSVSAPAVVAMVVDKQRIDCDDDADDDDGEEAQLDAVEAVNLV
jgi:hypothetical protein